MRKSQTTKIVLGTGALLLAFVGFQIYTVASGPDFDIQMVRRIPSKLSPTFLDQALNFYPHWPAWFHSGASLTQVDAQGNPIPKAQQKLQTGDYLRLGIDTKRLHGQYNVTLLVQDYKPRERLLLHVVGDSKNSLTRIFDRLDWQIDFAQGTGTDPKTGQKIETMLVGTASAHTHHWRARVFGKFAPKIILNQVFYPDLMILAEINDPDVVFPDAGDEHGGM
jgi:hypothetical protein